MNTVRATSVRGSESLGIWFEISRARRARSKPGWPDFTVSAPCSSVSFHRMGKQIPRLEMLVGPPRPSEVIYSASP